MSAQDEFDRRLINWMADAATKTRTDGRFEQAVAATVPLKPRQRRVAGFGSDWVGTAERPPMPVWPPASRVFFLGAVAALMVIAAIAWAALIGAQHQRTDPFGAAAPELVYAADGDIYVVKADGAPPVRIADGTPDGPSFWDPHWSPDGLYLMYEEEWAGQSTMHVLDGEFHEVSSFPGWYSTWSPDSSQIATWGGADDAIAIRSLAGALVGSVAIPDTLQGSGDQRPGWSADGNAILLPAYYLDDDYPAGLQAWLLSIEGGEPSRLSPEIVARDPAYAPDGTHIAMSSELGLAVTDADGTGARLLTDPTVAHAYRDPLWSPDGTRIAVSEGPFGGPTSIQVIEVRTGDATTVYTATAAWVTAVDWSPDGGSILVRQSPESAGSSFWRVPADGGEAQLLVDAASPEGADWRPAHATPLPADGALAPGTYYLAKDADSLSDYRRIVVTVPSGWVARDGFVMKHPGEPGEIALSAWTPSGIYADPCHWRDGIITPVEHSHDATGMTLPLDAGLAAQADRGPMPRPRTQTRLGGIGTLRVRLSVPADLDLATCDDGEFRSWKDHGFDPRVDAHHAPGQLDDVYLVDVDRAALVIDASHMPGASAADLAELDSILATLRID